MGAGDPGSGLWELLRRIMRSAIVVKQGSAFKAAQDTSAVYAVRVRHQDSYAIAGAWVGASPPPPMCDGPPEPYHGSTAERSDQEDNERAGGMHSAACCHA